MSTCRWIASDRPRILPNRHEDDCPGECAGCLECTELHCFVQWHGERGDCETHAETVCPKCVAKVREHLEEIVRLSGLPLVGEVLTKGANSEAADLLGPAADPKQWRQRSDYGHIFEPDSRLGWHLHPAAVLGWFDMLVTEHLGHKRTGRATVERAADYLGRNLHFLAADREFDFPDLAEALADCRVHVERVLHDGEQVETGAPCLNCEDVRLVRTRGDGEDQWTCPRCKRRSTDGQYRFAIKAEFIDRSPELNADDMATRIGVASSTIRRWSHVLRTQVKGEDPIEHPPILKSVGVVNGRKVYLVTDAEAIRDSGGDQRRRQTRATAEVA